MVCTICTINGADFDQSIGVVTLYFIGEEAADRWIVDVNVVTTALCRCGCLLLECVVEASKNVTTTIGTATCY